MDKINFHYHSSIFNSTVFDETFWNIPLSSENKYRIRHKIFDNKVIRKLKKTIFVFTTDAWHLFQFLYGISFAVAFLLIGCFYNPIFAIPAYLLNRFVFEITFKYLLEKRK